MKSRSLYQEIWTQIAAEKSLILLAGPRQAGKTTFARDLIAKGFADTQYFNWDLPGDKRKLLSDPAFFTKAPLRDLSAKPLVILDELHKYRNWKNYLKGVYDEYAADYQFLVTGSGRLEYSRKAGDSLAGRFLKFHLFPFTLGELCSVRCDWDDFIHDPLEATGDSTGGVSKEIFWNLWEFGGFPEPFSKGRKTFWRQWSTTYEQQIIRDDLKTMADLRNLDVVETAFALLPLKVGSPLSMNNLAQDLQVAFDTVKNWLTLFDAFYLAFRLSPWSAKVPRSLLKEKKIYLFNYPTIEDSGARLENLIAVELQRAVETWNDCGRGNFSLHYLRNKEKQEVDFLIADNRRPILLLEAKMSDETPSSSLLAFQEILRVPAIQLTAKEDVKKVFRNGKDRLLVITAHRWLAGLP